MWELKPEGRESPCLTSAENGSIRLPTFFTVLCKWSGVWLHGSSYVDLSVISCSMGQKLEDVWYTSLQETVIKHLCYIRQLYINCKYVAVYKITYGLLSLGSNNLQCHIDYSVQTASGFVHVPEWICYDFSNDYSKKLFYLNKNIHWLSIFCDEKHSCHFFKSFKQRKGKATLFHD